MQWNPSSDVHVQSSATKGGSQQFPQYDSGLDKENARDLKHESDLSLYDSSPNRASCVEDHDSNTQDSGYGESKFYQIAQSLGVTPQTCWSGKRTFGSLDSFDEEFMNLEGADENAQLPTDFNTLICGKLAHSSELNELTPNGTRSCVFEARPPKRAKSALRSSVLERSTSVSEETIKCAIQRSSAEPELIGDFSKTYCLPLTSGRHQDLKSIAPSTLANLIKGHFSVLLDSYKIVDCRFPYEFDGGHVNGAVNIYTKDQILDLLNEEIPEAPRHVLIFHCEFSSERGPNLCRFLRNLDRIRNKDAYPKLSYPELYVLEGGYKKFYEQYGDFCLPKAYKPMLHPEHQTDLRYFKSKSKSSSESRLHPSNRGKFKRLGFL